MKTRNWLIGICTLIVLVNLLIITTTHQTLAETSSSEQYQLTVFGLGSIPNAMQSSTYVINEGAATLPEVSPPMRSEHYQVDGVIVSKVFLPVVLNQ